MTIELGNYRTTLQKAKDFADTLTRLRRPRSFRSVQAIGVICCLASLGPTLIAASSSNSIALMADAVAMGIDTIFELVIFLALRAIQRQNAFIFPYGTGRFETLVSTAIAISLLVSALMLFVLSGFRLMEPVQPAETGLGVVMIAVNLAMSMLFWNWARRADDNDSVIAREWRRQIVYDVVLTAVVLVSVIAASALGGVLSRLDSIAAIIVAGVMLVQAVRSLRATVWELSDRALEEEVQLSILRGLAESFDDFDDLIDVRSRRSGGLPHIDVVLGFERERQWHDILSRCTAVRGRIEQQVRGARIKVLPSSALLWTRS